MRYHIPTKARSKKLKKYKLNLIEFVISEDLDKLNIIIIKIGVKLSK